MAFLQINPRYQQLVEQQGLTTAAHFLEMPSVIICGHADRNVARVRIGTGSGALAAFLKREHRVPCKDRLRNAVAGFGFVSKSRREAMVLRRLQQAGVRCPDWVALGEDDRGRAFLMLREVTGSIDLRLFLQNHRPASADERRRFARTLGKAVACFHNAGFDHPDLYSKHVLVNVGDQSVSFLDWQRSRRQHSVDRRRRCRDLAALEATLADDLATVRERITCLRAYLQESRLDRIDLCSSARHIRRLAGRLLRQRRIRELRQAPTVNDEQGLIWQDGEALCLTSDFQTDLAGRIPDWLMLANFPAQPRGWVTHTWVDVPKARRALLVYRRESRLLSRLWSWLRRRPWTSAEVCQAGLLFRLERYGIRVPRLLAFGQRPLSGYEMESFLLTEPPPGAVRLGDWLADHSTDLAQGRQIIREAGRLLRRIHSLHCYLGGQCGCAVVQQDQHESTNIVFASIAGLDSRRRPNKREALKDLAAFHSELASTVNGRTDSLRFLMSYLGLRKSCAAAKHMARDLRKLQNAKSKMQIGILQFPRLHHRTPSDAEACAQGARP